MTSQDGQRSKVSDLSGRGSQSSFSGRGRGRGCGRGHGGQGRSGRSCGRGRGRAHYTRQYNPYSMAQSYNSFVPEARSYPPEEWNALSGAQKEAVIKTKSDAGWINSYTPPVGYNLDAQGRPTLSNSLVAAVQSVIGQVSTQSSSMMSNTLMPPLPHLQPFIETPALTPLLQAGQAFR